MASCKILSIPSEIRSEILRYGDVKQARIQVELARAALLADADPVLAWEALLRAVDLSLPKSPDETPDELARMANARVQTWTACGGKCGRQTVKDFEELRWSCDTRPPALFQWIVEKWREYSGMEYSMLTMEDLCHNDVQQELQPE